MHYGKAEPEECLQSITSSKRSPRKLLATQPSSITDVWDRNSSAHTWRTKLLFEDLLEKRLTLEKPLASLLYLLR